MAQRAVRTRWPLNGIVLSFEAQLTTRLSETHESSLLPQIATGSQRKRSVFPHLSSCVYFGPDIFLRTEDRHQTDLQDVDFFFSPQLVPASLRPRRHINLPLNLQMTRAAKMSCGAEGARCNYCGVNQNERLCFSRGCAEGSARMRVNLRKLRVLLTRGFDLTNSSRMLISRGSVRRSKHRRSEAPVAAAADSSRIIRTANIMTGEAEDKRGAKHFSLAWGGTYVF